MRRAARLATGSLLAVGVILATGALTRARYTAEPERAELRLTWRTAAPRVVRCRVPTEAEQAPLPVHMRQAEICEGRPLDYRLEVWVDGELRYRSVERAAGARSDRPMNVFVELPMTPGRHRVAVVFERDDGAGDASGDDSVAASGADSTSVAPVRTAAVPARLTLDRRVRVGVHDVALISYDPDGRRLFLVDNGREDDD